MSQVTHYVCDSCAAAGTSNDTRKFGQLYCPELKHLCPKCLDGLSRYLASTEIREAATQAADSARAYAALTNDFLALRKRVDDAERALATTASERDAVRRDVANLEQRNLELLATESDLRDQIEFAEEDIRLLISFLGNKKRRKYAAELAEIEAGLKARVPLEEEAE